MKKETIKFYETELYMPVKSFFEEQGYEVHGEVKSCDMTANKGEEVVIIELKRSFTLELLMQAAKRQRLTYQVYVAIPRPKYHGRSKKWKDMCYLLRRLELGLIIVSFRGKTSTVEIAFDPGRFDREKSVNKSKGKRLELVKEMEARYGDYNIGGSTRTKIMTAYKENCIHVACCLKKLGPLPPKKLRDQGTGSKTLSILNKNFYGWFEKVGRGIYCLSKSGEEALKEYPELVQHYMETVRID